MQPEESDIVCGYFAFATLQSSGNRPEDEKFKGW